MLDMKVSYCTKKITFSTIVLLILISCASQPNQTSEPDKNSSTVNSPVSNRNSAAASFPDTPSKDEKIIQQGKFLYTQNCGFCHQKDAIGKPGKAPSLTNPELLSISSTSFMAETIADGRPGTGMPPFSHLGNDKIIAIISYLFSYSERPSRASAIDSQPKAKGDIETGMKLFDSICLPCHGPNGNGYVAGGTGTAIGTSGFLNKASDGFIRTTIKEGRSNTRMKSYQGPAGLADLSDKEIDDIISYLRSIPGK